MNFQQYLSTHMDIAISTLQPVDPLVELIIESIERDHQILCLGNGGSSTTADHFATDLTLLYEKIGKKCSAISLCSNSGILTAVSNDIGFEDVFSYQLNNFIGSNSLLIGFSASGNSTNLLNAFIMAKQFQFKTAVVLGFDGGLMQNIDSDYCIVFKDEKMNYGVAENLHLSLCHYVIDCIKDYFVAHDDHL